MVHSKKVVCFGLAAAGFLIAALLVACVAMGGDSGLADDRIADLSVSGSGGALAASSVTSSINYQGRLTDSSGNPPNLDKISMTFKLYDSASGKTALATDTHLVTVTDGLFSTNITFDPSYFDGQALWLGIKLEGEASEMTPRQELRPVPYALSLRPGAVINGSVPGSATLKVINTYEGTNYGDGIWAHVYSNDSYGVYARTYGDDSEGVYAHTSGDDSPAVYGWSEEDVGVYGRGNKSGGYFTTTAAGTSTNLKPGVNVSTRYHYNPGVLIDTIGNGSNGVSVYTYGEGSRGVYANTSGPYSEGVVVRTYGKQSEGVSLTTYGDLSHGVYAYTLGNGSAGVLTGTEGDDSTGVFVAVYGDASEGVHVYTDGEGSRGVYAKTERDYSEGVVVRTYGKQSEGIDVVTDGDVSHGVYAYTLGDGSAGVLTGTEGDDSTGIFVGASGDASEGIYAFSDKYHAIAANTHRLDHNYAFYTEDDNIYVGGKIDLVGTVDPIIVEGFNADPAVAYELGDVVCLAESGSVKQCSKADDTRIVGVVGPTVELADGEITVVIIGHQGAKPDEEHVQVLEQRLQMAEARKVETQQLTRTGKLEEAESLDSEIAMLRSELDEAKSVTRQVVRVKADASYGGIKAGDLLTTSSTSGHAMKAQPVDLGGVEIYRPGTIIGKALEPLNSGTGLIEVFVTLQ
jgi:hypothetical protein